MDEQFTGNGRKIDYLYLPDDDLDATGKIEVTQEIPAVNDLGSTGEFLLVDEDNIVPVAATPIRTDGSEAEVYGLNIPKPTYDGRRVPSTSSPTSNLPLPPWAMAALGGGLALAILGALVLPRCIGPKEEPPAPVVEVVPEEPEIEPALTGENIRTLAGSLSYDGASVAVPALDVSAEVKDGHVVVTHVLKSLDGVDATALVTDSSRRAVALSNALTGQRVDAQPEVEGTAFSKLTWVVKLDGGDILLAISEDPATNPRTAEGTFGLLTSAKGFVLSGDLLAALGGESGLSATAGEAPTDVNGAAISATAAFPHEEPEPEPEPEPEYYEETYYEETYSEEPAYEETYYEETYDEGGY